jgi:hypothetical protein
VHAKRIHHVQITAMRHHYTRESMFTLVLLKSVGRIDNLLPLEMGWNEQQSFCRHVGSPNPEACYRYFNGANACLLEPFLRKFLFYHVELAYLCLFLQTAMIILERWANHWDSDATRLCSVLPLLLPSGLLNGYGAERVWLYVTIALLAWQFVSFHLAGVYVLKYFDRPLDEVTVTIPFFGKQTMYELGCFFNGFNTMFIPILLSVSTLDLVLFALWTLFFYNLSQPYNNLCSLTSLDCYFLILFFSVYVSLWCAVSFQFLHPFITAFVFIAVVLCSGAFRRDWSEAVRRFDCFWFFSSAFVTGMVFLVSVGYHLMWDDGELLIALWHALLRTVFVLLALLVTDLTKLKSVSVNLKNRVLDRENAFFSNFGVESRTRYFQFLSIYYFARLIYLISCLVMQ